MAWIYTAYKIFSQLNTHMHDLLYLNFPYMIGIISDPREVKEVTLVQK